MNDEQTLALQPHQLRVLEERAQLHERITKLDAFHDSPKFSSLPAEERVLLFEQRAHMGLYLAALDARIQLWGMKL